jgi:hypothetical protein
MQSDFLETLKLVQPGVIDGKKESLRLHRTINDFYKIYYDLHNCIFIFTEINLVEI